ncbi:CoA transferase [Streptomyces sp. NPDC052496]|uniref:CoA transferase n=1 Tax=Streptomyces sp. NPDC052496 TaxID=3154951 RepID=UPI00342A56EF
MDQPHGGGTADGAARGADGRGTGGDTRPRARSQEPRPRARSQEPRPGARAQESRPEAQSQESRPEAQSQEPRPEARLGTPQGTPSAARSGTDAAWAALGGDPALTRHVTYGGPAGVADGPFAARLPVLPLARSTVAVCALAAAELAARRTGNAVPDVRVDDGAVATAFVSERHLRVDGRAPSSFAPLSRFWRTADGWVRTHANYPHHRARLLAALGLPDTAETAAVAAELAGRSAEEVERTVYAAGGLAVAVRTPGRWAGHEQGTAVAARPLLTLEHLGAGAPPRRLTAPGGSTDPLLPAAGVRVLDLTRVIAGPVATRTLALLGADVLRIDAPQLPESQDAHSDTGFGKRSATLDLGSRSGRATFDALLATADVLVTGYRPGALDRYGLAPEDLAERRPGLVVARLSAWGGYGPWGGRRGFDSLVQAACGIAVVEAGPDGTPGALPAQALDHGTGYLLAAAVLRALTEQSRTGGTRLATLALAQTAAWLLHDLPGTPHPPAPPAHPSDPASPPPASPARPYDPASHPPASPARLSDPASHPPASPVRPYDPALYLAESAGPVGHLRHALPPVSFAGGPANWSRPPGHWGGDAPVWRGH